MVCFTTIAMRYVNTPEKKHRRDSHHRLDCEKLPPICSPTGEDSIPLSKERESDCPPYSGNEVNTDDIQGVVIVETVFQAHTKARKNAAVRAKENGRHRGECSCRRGDGNKSCHQTRGCTKRRCVAIPDLLYRQPPQHGARSSRRGVHSSKTRQAISSKRRTTIETTPPKPQQRGAKHDEGEIVGTRVGLRESFALPDHQYQDECGSGCGDVDDRAARKVNGSNVSLTVFTPEYSRSDRARPFTKNAPTPHHVCEGKIHKRDPHAGEHHPCADLHTAGDRTGDNRHGDHRESQLKSDINDVCVAIAPSDVGPAPRW